MRQKIFLLSLVFTFFNCTTDDSGLLNTMHIGIVKNRTSCTSVSAPVYIIHLKGSNVIDSIMTSTLELKFQVEKTEIAFRIKPPKLVPACTQDKFYPKYYDVYDVELID